jgi:Protein of unknown function (DUF1501)
MMTIGMGQCTACAGVTRRDVLRRGGVGLGAGGVRGGQVIGASDAHAAAPADRAVTPWDLLATMYHSLGIDARQSLSRPDGESYPLIENGAVIHEMFA